MGRWSRDLLIIVALLSQLGLALPVVADDGALPSWGEGEVRAAILTYLTAVTDPADPDFIPLAERVAVLDNDGTFWCERPANMSSRLQVHLLRTLVAAGKVDGQAMPHRAWLAGDRDALRAHGWREAYQQLNTALAGMPVTTFADSARAFLARERHERFDRPHTDLYYVPMLELADLLAVHDFQVWVVTGSEQSFVRAYIEAATGVPPERIIGTATTPKYTEEGGRIVLVRGEAQVYNGHEHKVQNIFNRIGRRPVFAAGNSNNDAPMCRYAVTGSRRGLAVWIHHDDPDREYDYDYSTDRIAELCREHPAAHEVSMRRDWVRLFR